MRKLIKKKMIDMGRNDFTVYLGELLGISKAAASAKLRGKTRFNETDITILTIKLGFSAEELKNAIVKD